MDRKKISARIVVFILMMMATWYIIRVRALPDRINPDIASLIYPGMHLNEVVDIIGKAPGKYATTETEMIGYRPYSYADFIWWESNEYAIGIAFDATDCAFSVVCERRSSPSARLESVTFFNRLQNMLNSACK